MKIPKTVEESFLADCRRIIYGVAERAFVKKWIMTHNYDDRKLERIKASFDAAVAADNCVAKELGEQRHAMNVFEEMVEQAASVFEMHADFIKLIIWDDTEKMSALGLNEKPHEDPMEWLKHTISVYDKVSADKDLIETMKTRYNIGHEDLDYGRLMLVDAQAQKLKFRKEEMEASAAIERKTKAFNKLLRDVRELAVVCYHSLKQYPKILKELGIPVMQMSILEPKMLKA